MTKSLYCYWLKFGSAPRLWIGQAEVTDKSIRIDRGMRETPDYKNRFTGDEMRFFRETEPEARAVFVEHLRGLAKREFARADSVRSDAEKLARHADALSRGPIDVPIEADAK